MNGGVDLLLLEHVVGPFEIPLSLDHTEEYLTQTRARLARLTPLHNFVPLAKNNNLLQLIAWGLNGWK